MPMFYVSILIAVASSSLYHFSQKSTPGNANPAVALLATYVVATGLTLLLLVFIPARGVLLSELGRLNWASYVLALSIVGLEVGFLLVYRSGWNIGLAAVLVNVAASLVLVPVAIFYFKDRLGWINLLGILVCLAGLVMLNWER
jgi:drug/metabolite transporter (DMT)-like permease